MKEFIFMKRKRKDSIQLSDHFTYGRILRFCAPTMAMMLFTSIYGVVDGFFVSNFVGKDAFAAVNLIMPAISFVRTLVFEMLSVLILPEIFGVNGIWASVFVAEIASAILSWTFLIRKDKKYRYFRRSL